MLLFVFDLRNLFLKKIKQVDGDCLKKFGEVREESCEMLSGVFD